MHFICVFIVIAQIYTMAFTDLSTSQKQIKLAKKCSSNDTFFHKAAKHFKYFICIPQHESKHKHLSSDDIP
uniref:Secreted protein n=1 Tax=Anguilla anguilla TaxID=7936 RepID=A0A0E9WPU8_ANGAN